MIIRDIREITIKDDDDWLTRHAWLYPAFIEVRADYAQITVKYDMRVAATLHRENEAKQGKP